MNSLNSIYIGIDPASGNKDFSYAALDDHLDLVELAEADTEEMVALVSRQESAFVAINSPSSVNRGLVKQKLADEHSGPGRSVRGADIRLAEYELRARGIAVAGTPSREEFCPSWMQVGFALYRRLSEIGFKPYGSDGSGCQVLETHPFACYCALADGIPLSKATLEGRLQRQLILNDKGLRIKDGMEFFEEITRFKLLRGSLPMKYVLPQAEINAWLAAYSAWLAAHAPQKLKPFGDTEEGLIFLPCKNEK
jgi:predicted nuclease with RNAse H fold